MLKYADRQTERTTLHEVATLAGVSVSTVSLVLAGKAGNRRISEDTRARVKRAAEDLNYAPNLLTRSLRRRKQKRRGRMRGFVRFSWEGRHLRMAYRSR